MSRIALILCGGMGTRFASVSTDPKILAKFRGKLFIDWLTDYIIDHAFDKIVYSLGYKSDQVISHIEKINKEISIDYLVEEVPLGTGGAIKAYFERYGRSELYVFNGDTFFSKKLPIAFFSTELSNTFSVVCKNFSVNERYGDFSINNGKLQIKRGTKSKPIFNSNVYCGVARFPISTNFSDLPPKFSTEDLFLNQDQEFKIFKYNGILMDFGVPEAYYKLKNLYEI